jgi:hypothetical protein
MCVGTILEMLALSICSAAWAIGITILVILPILRWKSHMVALWCCRELCWHKGGDRQSFDGCSFLAQCVHCGEVVTQDSQGNWF